MAPLAGIALSMVPELLKMLPMFSSGSKSAERNIAVTQELGGKLFEAAKAVVPDAPNEQAIVAELQADPMLQRQFQAQVALRWDDVQPFLEFEAKERKEARDFAERMTSKGPFWRQVGYAIALFIVSMTVIGTFVGISVMLLMDEATAAPLREKVYDNWQIFMAAAVFFWLGSSSGSQRKDSNRMQ